MLLRKSSGIHIPGRKDMSIGSPIEEFLNPEYVYISLLTQNYVCKPLVKIGDKVLMGQPIAKREDRFSHPLHSSVSGEVTAIKKMWHSTGKMVEMIEIKNDFLNKADSSIRLNTDLDALTKETIIERIQNAGIVGMGGGGFPSHAKYTQNYQIDAIIINAAECEPYITADYMLIKTETERLMRGCSYMMKASGAPKGFIAIKKTKLAAIEALQAIIENHPRISIFLLDDVYPAGWEKYIVERIMKKTYLCIPLEVGAIVNNVQTAIAIADAVEENMPLIHKVVTVTGEGVANPHNFLVKIGTKANDLIAKCGGYVNPEVEQYFIAGGPMTGTTMIFDELIITNALSSIIVKPKIDISVNPICIGCGKCAEVCPAFLTPTEIKRAFEDKDIQYLLDLGATNCVGCGLCSYVCPSRIELTDATTRGRALALKG